MAKFGLICGTALIGGKEVMSLELARGFQSSGHSVHVVTTSWCDPNFIARLQEEHLTFDVLPLGFISASLEPRYLRMTTEQLRRWPELLMGYRRFLRTARPMQVIHTNWHHLLMLWPCLRADRDLFWMHEVVPHSRHYKIIFKALSRRLRCFVAVSHAVGASLQRLGIPSHQIRIIHNAFDGPQEDAAVASTQPGEPIRLGIVGQVGAWKGHDDFLESFRQIAPQWPDTELHIFGKGLPDYERHLRALAANWGIADRVKWHGFVKDRSEIFSRLDICVVPTRTEEPFGLVAAEAAGFGLPVVASRIGGLPEVVEDGVTGLLVPPNDPDNLAAAIRQLLGRPGLRRTLGAKAKERMMERFSKERFMTEFLTLLQATAL